MSFITIRPSPGAKDSRGGWRDRGRKSVGIDFGRKRERKEGHDLLAKVAAKGEALFR